MNRFLQQLHMPAELVLEFMVTFSRLEYALKSTGYILGRAGRVEPAWDAFANEIDEDFNQLVSNDLTEAKNLLLNSPPKKQVVRDGQLIFQDQVLDKNQRTTQQVIRFVRTVRNNLFHGGKFLSIGDDEEGRNEALVRASLKIIKTCIEINVRVKQRYEC